MMGRLLRGCKKGGESESVDTLCSMLMKRGHELLTISLEEEDVDEENFIGRRHHLPVSIPKVDVVVNAFEMKFRYLDEFKQKIADFNPDLIMYRKDWSYLGCRIGKELGIPTVLKLYDYEFYYGEIDKNWNPRLNMVMRMPLPLHKKLCRYILNRSDVIIGNSNRTVNIYKPLTKNENIYPIPSFVDTERFAQHHNNDGDAIVHITPSKNKGIDITLDVAKHMKKQKFIIAGQSKGLGFNKTLERMRKMKNVDYIGYVPDIIDVYKKAKIILMPSLDEGFGRIPIEAGAMGIPVITSGKGGLADSSHPELIVKSNCWECYLEKIDEVNKHMDYFSKLSIFNSVQKSIDTSFQMFCDIVKDNLGVKI